MSDDERAIESLRRAVQLAPRDPVMRQLLAERLAATGHHRSAVAEYRALIALAPDDHDALLGLARELMADDEPAEALPVLERLLKVAPSSEASALRAAALGRSWATTDGSDEAAPQPPVLSPAMTREAAAATQAQVDPLTTPTDDTRMERPTVTFADVGGMAELKEEIRLKVIYPQMHPELYAAYGKQAGGGILMYGPPGCGKTYLATAAAGELGASFIHVGIADVLDMWIGSSERNLHAMFEVARAHRPCVVFFDEVDALAASRSDFKLAPGRGVINQFLAEMDGIGADNEGLLVLGATNAPWHLDPAFRRPGRFGQVIFVPPPDGSAREEILRLLLAGRPAEGVDVRVIAARTGGYSGADLRALVEAATEQKLRAALADGVVRPVTTSDLLGAQKAVTASTKQWFLDVRNYVKYANQSGLYDPVRPYLD